MLDTPIVLMLDTPFVFMLDTPMVFVYCIFIFEKLFCFQKHFEITDTIIIAFMLDSPIVLMLDTAMELMLDTPFVFIYCIFIFEKLFLLLQKYFKMYMLHF